VKIAKTVASFIALSSLLMSRSASATLIMAICNGDALYVGSDSLQTSVDYTYTSQVDKIRALDKNCCFSLSGVARLTPQVHGRTLEFDSFEQMERAFRKAESSNRSLLPQITNTVMLFERTYGEFCGKYIAGGATNSYGAAVFTFWGYDQHLDRFFGLGWACEGTNHGVFQGMCDFTTNVGRLFLQGESDFLSAFVRNHNDFPTVGLSDRSRSTWDKLVLRQAVTEDEVVSEMVELFALHKRYSAAFFPHSGHIAEPYVIWRLRKDDTRKIGTFRPRNG
jgi:hypothetical protein